MAAGALISLAAGFAAVWPLGYVAMPALHSAWPVIPAGILTAVGLVSLTG